MVQKNYILSFIHSPVSLLRHSVFILFFLLLFSCNRYAKITSIETSVIELTDTDTLIEDIDMIREIAPYKKQLEQQMNDVLAYSDQQMIKGYPEGLLGNFVADLILKKARDYCNTNNMCQIDFCLLNNGGLRADLPKGEITRNKIFELMPFENELVVLTLTGKKTKQLFNYLAKYDGMPVSGVKLGIKDATAVNILIDGKPFDINKNYKVVTSDYLASGGDKMYFFSNPVHTITLEHYKVRDAIIEFIIEENNKGNTLKAKLDKRIYYIK